MTNPTPDALLPCPFCGGGNIAYVTNGDREWTTCDDCLSEGPDAATQDEALAAWNRRDGQSHDAGLLAALERISNSTGCVDACPCWAKLRRQASAAIAAAKGA